MCPKKKKHQHSSGNLQIAALNPGCHNVMSNINWQEIWAELGIHSELVDACKLPLYEETLNLVSAGVDIFDREQFVTAATLNCLQKMKAAAQQNGIDLAMISAFRSVDYPCQLILDTVENVQDIRTILQ